MTAATVQRAPHHGLVLAPLALPRASTLTDLLLGGGDAAGCGAGPAPTPDDLADLARRLEGGLAALVKAGPPAARSRARHAGPRPAGRAAVATTTTTATATLRVTGYLLRTAHGARPMPDGTVGPGAGSFAWSPTSARRALGLAAVRRCLAGAARWPAEAVDAAIEDLVADGRHGLGGAGSLAAWLGALPGPALAVVRAEAVTWATRLWTALDWERLGEPVEVGGPERHWASASTPSVSLRRRVDVRVGGAASAFLTVLPGWPGDTSRVELGLAALVAAVSEAPGGVPLRVAGWWPESGRALVVPVDHALLEETAAAVVGAVTTVRGMAGAR